MDKKSKMEDFSIYEIETSPQLLFRGGQRDMVPTEEMQNTTDPHSPSGWSDDCTEKLDETDWK